MSYKIENGLLRAQNNITYRIKDIVGFEVENYKEFVHLFLRDVSRQNYFWLETKAENKFGKEYHEEMEELLKPLRDALNYD